MATKKLLTYEGLQKYNVKWHERLEEMAMSVSDVAELCEDAFDLEPEEEPSTPDEPTASWSELPIQSNAIDTGETIYLALGNNFRYEPSGGGTKHISVVASDTAVNSQSFKLEIIDAADFPIEWASNIQWKNDAEPAFTQYHTDVLLFETSNNGETWVGEVLSTTAMTPYWKIKVIPRNNSKFYYGDSGGMNPDTMMVPINAAAIDSIDWGDGTVETSQSFTLVDDIFPVHSYTTLSLFTITIRSTKFDTGYIATAAGIDSTDMHIFMNSLVEIVNPLPELKGSYQAGAGGEGSSGDSYGDSYGAGDDSGEGDSEEAAFTGTDETFHNIFRSYPFLRFVPDYLFVNNPYPVGANCFTGCADLTSIPPHLFDNEVIINFDLAFENCSSIKSIPDGLFDRQTRASTFSSCFSGCSSLQSIPEGLFDKNTSAISFTNCFFRCSSIQSIPEGLFDKNTAVTSFSHTFYGCSSIQSIPEGLFDKNTRAKYFSSCFELCTSLQSIPSGLFDKNTDATGFDSCFCRCISLQSIPSGLFDKNTVATSFSYCFYYCSSLQSIPSGLFDKNTRVTDFGSCFYQCTSLQSIPSGLFDKNTAVTNFKNCFYYCSSLQSIPEGLFNNNVAVDSFETCFYRCSSLQSIPEQLFMNNTNVTILYQCFYQCSSLDNFVLHIGSTKVSSCSGFVSNKTGTTRTVYVPNNSTTQTKFNNIASACGLTVIGE